ncbi:MAG: hypothetical protein K9L17_13370 [Clostridiales bacterium]|nr:hypothetical protein [Clostridiales bacterium]MCF8023665.1 hypothetical protein [Clostridiales bacterium]
MSQDVDLENLDLRKGPYSVKSKTLDETVIWALDDEQAEKVKDKGITYTKKELEYIQNSYKPMTSFENMYVLKKHGVKVTVNPWAESPDTKIWLVL